MVAVALQVTGALLFRFAAEAGHFATYVGGVRTVLSLLLLSGVLPFCVTLALSDVHHFFPTTPSAARFAGTCTLPTP